MLFTKDGIRTLQKEHTHLVVTKSFTMSWKQPLYHNRMLSHHSTLWYEGAAEPLKSQQPTIYVYDSACPYMHAVLLLTMHGYIRCYHLLSTTSTNAMSNFGNETKDLNNICSYMPRDAAIMLEQ